MARHLVRLKLRLLRAGVRIGGASVIAGLVLAFTLAALAGIVGGMLGMLLRLVSPDWVELATVGLCGAVFLVWVLGPLVIVGAEKTLDVDRLILLPVSGRQLIPGLLAASLLGPGGSATLLVTTGIVVGLVPLGPSAVVTLLAAVVFLAACATWSRVVSTWLAGSRSRRWGDVVLFLGPVLALVLNIGVQLASRSVPTAAAEQSEGATRAARLIGGLARLLPSGPPAMAMAGARRGDLFLAVLALVAGVAYLALGFALWWKAIARVLVSPPPSTGPRRGGEGDLIPRALAFLPRTRIGAVAAKEVRVSWRDPRQRAALIASIFPAVVIMVTSGGFRSRSPSQLLFLVLIAFVLAGGATNVFGFDGPRHWTNVAAGDDLAADLKGKAIARIVLNLPVLVLAGVLLTGRAGSAAFLPSAVGLAVLAFGLALGSGAWASVFGPMPLPDSTNPFSGGSTGHGAQAALPTLAVLLGGGAVLGPLVFLAVTMGPGVAMTVVAVFEGLAGLVAWRVGLHAALRRSQDRQPELLEKLSPRRA